jgi:hypothetical protein
MRAMWRKVKVILAFVVACGAASLPACGTMGGGGMHSFAAPASESATI